MRKRPANLLNCHALGGLPPERCAVEFLRTVMQAEQVDYDGACALADLHRLHFRGVPFTRERLVACLRMKYGRDGVAQIEKNLLQSNGLET